MCRSPRSYVQGALAERYETLPGALPSVGAAGCSHREITDLWGDRVRKLLKTYETKQPGPRSSVVVCTLDYVRVSPGIRHPRALDSRCLLQDRAPRALWFPEKTVPSELNTGSGCRPLPTNWFVVQVFIFRAVLGLQQNYEGDKEMSHTPRAPQVHSPPMANTTHRNRGWTYGDTS